MTPCIFCELNKDIKSPTRIVELNNSIAYINLDQTYPGRSIVVFKAHYDSLLDLPKNLFDNLNDELRVISYAVEKTFNPDRLNFAILGNVVSHLHWHIIPRYESDQNWGRPPWPINERTYLSDNEYREISKRILSQLKKGDFSNHIQT